MVAMGGGVGLKVFLRLVRGQQRSERSNAFEESDAEQAVDQAENEDHPSSHALEFEGSAASVQLLSQRRVFYALLAVLSLD